MRNQKADIAGVLFGLMLLAGLGQTYADPPLGFDMADNPFHPYNTYDPATQTGVCLSSDPCQTWDKQGSFAGLGDCQFNNPDTDGDGSPAYQFASGDWSNIDAGCITLQDWDQDGTCDHRVYDADRNQVDTPFEPVLFYHQYVGSGFWNRIVAPSPCSSWVGV